MISVPRLKQNRHGVFSLRVYWRDPQGQLRESLHSLGTKNPAVARVLALQFNEAFERRRLTMNEPRTPSLSDVANTYELDLSRGVMKSDGTPEDHDRMMQAIEKYKAIYGTLPRLQEAMAYGRGVTEFTPPATVTPLPRSKKFSEATVAYLEEKKHDNAQSTLDDKRRLFNEFQGLHGDLDMNQYTKAVCVQWKNHELSKGIGASRINKRLGYMNDFFKWAIGNSVYHHPQSPIDGLQISSKSKLAKKAEHWKPFTDDDVKAILTAGYKGHHKKPDHYWIPLVCFYSGVRLNEIARLDLQHVRIIDGVHALEITKTKTTVQGRTVPVHQDLISLGFWDYVEGVRGLGVDKLFPFLVDGKNGPGKNAGQHFAKWLKKTGVKQPLKVFHSTRPTVITRLHAANANAAHAMQITGHDGVQTQNVHHSVYTHAMGLAQLRDTLNLVKYPIDLEALKVPTSFWIKKVQRAKIIHDRELLKSKS